MTNYGAGSSLRFSIITPCLNPGPRLQRCIDAIRRQDHPHIEHIVIDGGSTDGTIELLERSEGLTWISEPDRGQSQAINKGFRLAGGDILTWVNADDVLLEGALTEVARLFEDRPDLGWVYSDVEEIQDAFRRVVPAPIRLTKTTFDFGNRFGPGTFFRTGALNRVGELDETFHLTMDLDLWLRFLDADLPSARISRPLVSFEIHEGSKTGSAGPVPFITEEARALAKNGRLTAAWMSMGRAAAARAWTDGVSVEEALAALDLPAGLKAAPWSLSAMRAGALTELSVKERSLSGLRHLLKREVWSFPETRRRVALCLRTTAARYLKPDPTR